MSLEVPFQCSSRAQPVAAGDTLTRAPELNVMASRTLAPIINSSDRPFVSCDKSQSTFLSFAPIRSGEAEVHHRQSLIRGRSRAFRPDSVRETRRIRDTRTNDGFGELLWAFWYGRIRARRRVVNLGCSCSGEARLHRIDLIREPASDLLEARSRTDGSHDPAIQPSNSGSANNTTT